MEIQTKLVLAAALSFVLLSANTVMASENGHGHDNTNDKGVNHHVIPFSGGSEGNTGSSTKTYKDVEHHKLKINGGNENDASPKVLPQTDNVHHKEVIDPTSVDYMGKQ